MGDIEVVKTSNKLTLATTIVCCLLFVVSIGTVAYSFYQREESQRDINHAVCLAVVKLDGAITASLHRSLRSLPTASYYKEHPDELKKAQSDTRKTLETFKPPPECGKTGATP